MTRSESHWQRSETLVIFEAGLNHNGELSLAKELVEAAAQSGASVVKFQKREISSLASRAMLQSEEIRFPSLGSTYEEVRTKLELSKDAYLELLELAHSRGLEFMVTPFDKPSLDFLLDIEVDSLKVASHSVADPRLLQNVAASGLAVVMSSGMVTIEELDRAVGIFRSAETDLAVLHCSSEYPTNDTGANLRLIQTLRDRYGLTTGFSGHELGSLHTIAAVAMGAKIVERHVTLSNRLEGFDHKMSMEVDAFAELVKDIRRLEVALGDGVTKFTPIEMSTRMKYRVSMVAARDLLPGETLAPEMVVYKNPGTGIPASQEDQFIGSVVRTFVEADTVIQPEQLSKSEK